MDDQQALDIVRVEALRYLRAGGGIPAIERIWIESQEDDGDLVVRVRWRSNDLEPGQFVLKQSKSSLKAIYYRPGATGRLLL